MKKKVYNIYMPQNTRVYRCVKKLTKRKGFRYGAAIAICQKSAQQNYMTGKSLKKTKQNIKKTKKYKRKNNAKK